METYENVNVFDHVKFNVYFNNTPRLIEVSKFAESQTLLVINEVINIPKLKKMQEQAQTLLDQVKMSEKNIANLKLVYGVLTGMEKEEGSDYFKAFTNCLGKTINFANADLDYIYLKLNEVTIIKANRVYEHAPSILKEGNKGSIMDLTILLVSIIIRNFKDDGSITIHSFSNKIRSALRITPDDERGTKASLYLAYITIMEGLEGEFLKCLGKAKSYFSKREGSVKSIA